MSYYLHNEIVQALRLERFLRLKPLVLKNSEKRWWSDTKFYSIFLIFFWNFSNFFFKFLSYFFSYFWEIFKSSFQFSLKFSQTVLTFSINFREIFLIFYPTNLIISLRFPKMLLKFFLVFFKFHSNA